MSLEINLNERDIPGIIRKLILLEIFFVGIYLLDHFLGHPSWQACELFDLDREANIPTWFSGVQLLLTGIAALLTCARPAYSAPPSKAGVCVLGLGFVYLSLDEAAVIHEKLTFAFYDNPLVPYFEGVHGIWIVVYGALGILLTACFFRDILAALKHHRRASLLFIAGMVIYLAGSAGAETVTFFKLNANDALIYTLEVAVEEFLEMVGASFLLGGVLTFACQKASGQRS